MIDFKTPFPQDAKQIVVDSSGMFDDPLNKIQPKIVSKLDRLNENLANECYNDPNATHVVQLHPTKGYRRKNIQNLLSSMNRQAMWNNFWGVIRRAQEHNKSKAE